jgi:hypothetical protein
MVVNKFFFLLANENVDHSIELQTVKDAMVEYKKKNLGNELQESDVKHIMYIANSRHNLVPMDKTQNNDKALLIGSEKAIPHYAKLAEDAIKSMATDKDVRKIVKDNPRVAQVLGGLNIKLDPALFKGKSTSATVGASSASGSSSSVLASASSASGSSSSVPASPGSSSSVPVRTSSASGSSISVPVSSSSASGSSISVPVSSSSASGSSSSVPASVSSSPGNPRCRRSASLGCGSTSSVRGPKPRMPSIQDHSGNGRFQSSSFDSRQLFGSQPDRRQVQLPPNTGRLASKISQPSIGRRQIVGSQFDRTLVQFPPNTGRLAPKINRPSTGRRQIVGSQFDSRLVQLPPNTGRLAPKISRPSTGRRQIVESISKGRTVNGSGRTSIGRISGQGNNENVHSTLGKSRGRVAGQNSGRSNSFGARKG